MKMKHLMTILVIIFILATTTKVFAVEGEGYGFKSGQFVELNGYLFRIVDAETNYLMLNNAFGNIVFDSQNSNIYDPSSISNVGYYLNTTFLSNISNFVPYIKLHSWGVDGKKGKIGIISLEEFYKYGGNSFPKKGSLYWTLTKSSYTGEEKRLFAIMPGSVTEKTVTSTLPIRPTLYLSYSKDLEITKGTGTETDPFVLKVNPFSGIELPIQISDLLSTSTSLVWLLGPFILLVLAIVYANKIIILIRKSIKNKDKAAR